ncbi:RNA polymerase subunit sigma-24 [Cellulomonas sp. Root485]|uniref:sigma-70 family RNA polymerase sigma factor n=1 Tax=Cellulomonas sp. Root485 TaxID=1736546 RepID=UPI0006FAAF6D|nr:sigma-70 family RNA polymerase sigma factor [Cellulomonas sp. Root485]KQY22737.1 RNA polymerase subunit sigma-24 [Cellulomonas sp. Root485]
MSGHWEPMLEQVVADRYARLVARAMLLVRSRADAEDLVQDALVSTFGGRARFRSVEQAEQYVRRAIVSRFIDRTRHDTVEHAALERASARVPTAVEDQPTQGLPDELRAALARLSPRQRACVVLRHVDDLSVRETATLLGLSEGAVKRYVADGVGTLNALLGTTSHSGDDEPVRLIPTPEVRHDA